MNNVKFGQLITYITMIVNRYANSPTCLSSNEVREINDLIGDDNKSNDVNIYANIDDVNELLSNMKQGKKIGSIKAYRELTGIGLVDAKNAIERYWSHSENT